jgi:UDP-N-acetylmuramoyl-L-alanyl-D-glutamate--2,6-diaminopimelate ligase
MGEFRDPSVVTPKPLTELLLELPGLLTWPPPEVMVTGVSGDSRQVQPGHLFVARSGEEFDGHIFVSDAVMSGASVIVGERPATEIQTPVPYLRVRDGREALAWLSAAWYGFPARKLAMIGVTGTDGKTTTINLLYHILRTAGIKTGMVSTVSAVIGEEEYTTGLHVTTPAAADVQRLLSEMVASGASHAILETTSHGLAQHRVSACDFDVAIITNVTHEHLDWHKNWEAYLAAKARLFEGLTTATRKPNVRKFAVLNADDASYETLSELDIEHLLCYGIENTADVMARDIVFARDGTRFTLQTRPTLETGTLEATPISIPISTTLVGVFNVANILAAGAAALELGIAPEIIQRGVGALHGIPGRMERVSDEGSAFLAIVDFAHTPNALRQTLLAARGMAEGGGRVIAVWGSAGLRDQEKRYLMGTISAQLADITIITAEDPRTEPLEAIMAESATACEKQGRRSEVDYWLVPDRGEALRFAVELARPGDVVIACGKGHEQSMCFGTTEYRWDDREALRRALRGEKLDTLPTAKDRPLERRKL